jgi:hypothetical protein
MQGIHSAESDQVKVMNKCKHGLTVGTCYTCKTGKRIEPAEKGQHNVYQFVTQECYTYWYNWFETWYDDAPGCLGSSAYRTVRTNPPKEENDRTKLYFVTIEEDSIGEIPIFTCRMCRKSFRFVEALNRHSVRCPQEFKDKYARRSWFKHVWAIAAQRHMDKIKHRAYIKNLQELNRKKHELDKFSF